MQQADEQHYAQFIENDLRIHCRMWQFCVPAPKRCELIFVLQGQFVHFKPMNLKNDLSLLMQFLYLLVCLPNYLACNHKINLQYSFILLLLSMKYPCYQLEELRYSKHFLKQEFIRGLLLELRMLQLHRSDSLLQHLLWVHRYN